MKMSDFETVRRLTEVRERLDDASRSIVEWHADLHNGERAPQPGESELLARVNSDRYHIRLMDPSGEYGVYLNWCGVTNEVLNAVNNVLRDRVMLIDQELSRLGVEVDR